ncbi:MAG: sigma-70 family RNA polymerase sigma factor [Treponema sp.]|nr:sigma-70 family RNA polymerase sigma factor [Treponema sp.]
MYQFKNCEILTEEEEKTLALDAKNGDCDAREKLIVSNIPFVVKCVKPFSHCGLSYDELIAEGIYGLINGVDHFDVDKGFRLITYARFWIRQAVFKALKENAPGHALGNPLFGLDDPAFFLEIEDKEGKNLEEECIEKDTIERVQKAVLSLRPREIEILASHYGLFGKKPMSFREIAAGKGRTAARVHQIEKNAILKLRKELSAVGE